jgi:hypothetical protein
VLSGARIGVLTSIPARPLTEDDGAVDATRSLPDAPTIGDAMAARLRAAAIAVVGCGTAGLLVGGVGSRAVMRIAAMAAPEARGAVTEAGAVVGDITLGGTLALMVFAGVGSALLGAGAYLLLGPWLPRETVARGLVFGLTLLALMGPAVIDPANADFVILGDRLLNVSMFSALFLAFGLVASGTIRFVDARVVPRTPRSPRMWLLTLVLAVPVVPGILGFALGSRSGLGVPLAVASLAFAASGPLERAGHRSGARAMRLAATATVVVILVAGASSYVSDAAAIL